MLLDRSAELGAFVKEEHLVTNVTRNDEGVIKIPTNHNGTKDLVNARFIIDASGQDSFLPSRKKTKVPYDGMNRAAFACHWSGVNYDEALSEGLIQIVYLGGEKKGWIWMIPLESDRISIGVALNADYVKKMRESYLEQGIKNWQEQLYLDELFKAKKSNQVLAKARRIQPVITISDFSYYSTDQYGDDYAIVGDAVAFLDPIFSSGIFMGMKSAFMVSEVLSENLKNNRNLSDGLEKVYESINGAYGLIEKFVRLFYDPDKLDMASLGTHSEMEYLKHEQAFALVHFLLAGDFFSQSARYSEFAEMLEQPEMITKYKNLVMDLHSTKFSCGHQPEEIYPDLRKKTG